MSIYLLWNSLFLLLSPFVIYPFHSGCPSVRRTFLHHNRVTSLFSIFRPLLIRNLLLPSHSVPLLLFLIWPAHTSGSALKKQRKSKNKLATAVLGHKTQADLELSLFFFLHYFFPLSTNPSFFSLYFMMAFLFLTLSFFLLIHHLLLYQFTISMSPLQKEGAVDTQLQPGLGVGRVSWGK